MKTSIFALSALSLASLVAAAPLKAKREDVVWVTNVEVVTTVVELTTTVWVDQLPPATSSAAGLFFESQKAPAPAAPTTTLVTTTSTTSSTSTTPTTTSTPAAVTSQVPVVEPTQPVQPPVQTTPAAQTSSAPAAAPSTPSGGSSGGSSGTIYTGDLTFYDPNGGYGSCGDPIQNSEDVVALPVGMMQSVSSKSNGHPWCGKKIAIYFGGQTYYAIVKDTCMGCGDGDVDMTSGLFKKVTNGAVDGRGKGLAKWSFV